jgi:hypothetical protein
VYCYLAISAQRRLTLITKGVLKELFIVEERIKLAFVGFWIDTALLVCLNSASAALVIAASASDTQSVEVVDLGM